MSFFLAPKRTCKSPRRMSPSFLGAVDVLHSAFIWSRRESVPRYINSTQFGVLRVELERPKQWSVYRGEYPLLRNGNPAVFTSSEEAQRAADLHQREGYPNSEIIF